MDSLILIWAQFAICLVLIGVAGIRLSRYGDAIAAQTGLSQGWIGLILVATVTSLPELVTGLSSVSVALAPDIAVGNVLGSCIFNLMVLAMADLLYRQQPLFSAASRSHLLSAGFGLLMLATAALALVLSALSALPAIGHVSVASPLIVGLYLVAMRALFLTEQRQAPPPVVLVTPSGLKRALMGYGIASAVIVVAGIWLPLIGVALAQAMGWSHSFVGTLLVALATTVPELATTYGAVRIGAVNLALGNLLGSNLFDVLILAIDDIAYLPGPLYTDVSPLHAVSALIACLMCGALIIALAYQPQSRVWRTASWTSIALMGLYLLNAGLHYRL